MNSSIKQNAIFKIDNEQGSTLCKWKSLSHGWPFATRWTDTGVGILSLLQWIFPTQALNPGLAHCRRILYQLSHKGSPTVQHRETLVNVMWQPGWEAMLREKGYMYMYGWIPLLSLKVITMLLISYAVRQNKKFIKIIENNN